VVKHRQHHPAPDLKRERLPPRRGALDLRAREPRAAHRRRVVPAPRDPVLHGRHRPVEHLCRHWRRHCRPRLLLCLLRASRALAREAKASPRDARRGKREGGCAVRARGERGRRRCAQRDSCSRIRRRMPQWHPVAPVRLSGLTRPQLNCALPAAVSGVRQPGRSRTCFVLAPWQASTPSLRRRVVAETRRRGRAGESAQGERHWPCSRSR